LLGVQRGAGRALTGRIGRFRPRRTRAIAAWVFLCAFALFSLSQGPMLAGYEPETAAVAEGFVRTGDFKYPPDLHPTLGEGIRLRSGKLIGRAGLPEELVAMPFFVAGAALDRIVPRAPRYWRDWTKLFYNPAVAALGAALLFWIVLRLSRSIRWGLLMAAAYSVASIAWPYAKIGMDTTLMLAMIGSFAAALAARESEWSRPWWLAGFCAGAAVAAKPYALPAVLAILVVLMPIRQAGGRRRLAVVLPFAAWLVAVAWFNYSRLGNALKTGDASFEATLAAPLNVLGFLFSPGKSVFLYSPLVLIGALGLPAFWRAHRRVALAALLAFGLLMATCALAPFWSDETWGPRYLVPVAWLGLLPIPWFATSRARRRGLALVAVLAVGVQLVGVVVRYDQILKTEPAVVGSPVLQYPRVPVPLGRDSVRWVPQLSPLLIQSAMVVSRLGETVGASPITYSYRPYAGQPHSVTFTDGRRARLDFWWWQGDTRSLIALVALMVGAYAALVLRRAAREADGRHVATNSPDGDLSPG
jgi:hypothetical protein